MGEAMRTVFWENFAVAQTLSATVKMQSYSPKQPLQGGTLSC